MARAASPRAKRIVLRIETDTSGRREQRGPHGLVYDGGGAPLTSVQIPGLSDFPPPPPPPVVTLTVHPLGCTTCRPGQVLGFELQVSNSGAPMLVELKTGARLPDGSVAGILGRHEEEVTPG